MGVLTAEDAIRKYLSGKKTPYQLDLEVKDRKPSIVPKVGDKVKIKSREWYEKWKKVGDGFDGPGFYDRMAEYCGMTMTVEAITEAGNYKFKEDKLKFSFSLSTIEEVYPVKEIKPYQLDLEVKDRKPSIIPKVGDRVKIKSRKWYEKWRTFIPLEHVNVMYSFNSEMVSFCGKVLTVRRINGDSFFLRNEETEVYWTFSLEMFEEVYPVQEQLSSKFPKIDLNSPYLYQSPYEVKGSELVLSEEEQERLKEQFFPPCSEREKVLLKKQPFFSSKIEETAKRLAAYSLVQGLDAKPKLKQIKTTHLIKLKKL